ERLDRSDDALDVIIPVLEVAPADPTALPILHRALGRASSRPRAAALLQKASESAPTPERSAAILQILLDAPIEDLEVQAERRSWYERLMGRLADRPEETMATALRAAVEFPEIELFWTSAENCARALARSQPVMDAYRTALELGLAQDTAEWLGQRAVDFH